MTDEDERDYQETRAVLSRCWAMEDARRERKARMTPGVAAFREEQKAKRSPKTSDRFEEMMRAHARTTSLRSMEPTKRLVTWEPGAFAKACKRAIWDM